MVILLSSSWTTGTHWGLFMPSMVTELFVILEGLLQLSSIIVHNNWRWPRPRNRITQEIIEHAPADLLPHVEREDRVVWILTQNGEYFSRSSWDALRSPRVEVI